MNKITDLLALISRTLYRLFFSPYMTPRRLWNSILIRFHEKFGLEVIRAYPETLIIEVTNSCDSTCRLCPVGEGRKARPASVLDPDTFMRFIDEVAPYSQKVLFHNWGEPLLDKHLADKIKYVHDKKMITSVATTLYHLTPELATEIVKAGLNELSVSIHAASQESYEAYQPGRSFNRVIHNIKMLNEARQSLNTKTPKISLTFVRTQKNQHEAACLADLVKTLGVDSYSVNDVSINSRFLWSDMAMKDRHLDEGVFLDEVRRRAEEWLPSDQLSKFDFTVTKAPKLKSCDRLWRVGLINSDGTVPPCCDVYSTENNFGEYGKGAQFLEIWNNQKFRMACRSFCKPLESGELQVCTHCPGHSSKNKARNPVRF